MSLGPSPPIVIKTAEWLRLIETGHTNDKVNVRKEGTNSWRSGYQEVYSFSIGQPRQDNNRD